MGCSCGFFLHQVILTSLLWPESAGHAQSCLILTSTCWDQEHCVWLVLLTDMSYLSVDLKSLGCDSSDALTLGKFGRIAATKSGKQGLLVGTGKKIRKAHMMIA